jgi:hypothetical protein
MPTATFFTKLSKSTFDQRFDHATAEYDYGSSSSEEDFYGSSKTERRAWRRYRWHDGRTKSWHSRWMHSIMLQRRGTQTAHGFRET